MYIQHVQKGGNEVTTHEAADILGIKVRTVRDWLQKGIITGEFSGKSWDIPAEEVTRKEKERAYTGR